MCRTALLTLLPFACTVLPGCGATEGSSADTGPVGTWLTTQFISGGHTATYVTENRTTVQLKACGTLTVRDDQGQQAGAGTVTNNNGVLAFNTANGNPPNGWSATDRLDYWETDDGVRITHLGSEVDFDELLVRPDWSPGVHPSHVKPAGLHGPPTSGSLQA